MLLGAHLIHHADAVSRRYQYLDQFDSLVESVEQQQWGRRQDGHLQAIWEKVRHRSGYILCYAN